jgi:receptor-type tyrosine-protein phosphatase N
VLLLQGEAGRVRPANNVMSDLTNKLTGLLSNQRPKSNGNKKKNNEHSAVTKPKQRNQKYLTTKTRFLTTFFVTTTFLLQHATAEQYIGCLLNEDVCDDNETCLDDLAFGRCVSKDNDSNDDFYRFPEFSAEEEGLLEDEMSRLYDDGFVWTDDYTQCVLQTALAAIRDRTEYDTQLCDVLLTQQPNDLMDFAEAFQQQPQAPPEEGYIILTDPMIDYESEDGLGDLDQIQNDEDTTINERSPRGLRLNEENEEPVELQGLDNLPLERSKYYALLNDYENDDSKLPPLGIEEELMKRAAMTDSVLDDNAGQQETFNDYDPELIPEEDDVVFDRHERMDVKKPGPFFEASPNNFYLDKLTYRYENDNNDNDAMDTVEGNNKTKNVIDNKDVATPDEQGQQEYEFPMSTSGKEKRRLTNDEFETEAANNYVHIALNDKFQTWKEGSDFINALAWELGLPTHALSDRTIEKNHVQFKVEPNDLDVDASGIADALNDISIKKGPSDNKEKRTMAETPLGVNIANVAAGGKDDRASVFPHGRNLNLLILVVVGASATASLVVGGLIFALASRRRGVAKNVSKLQLSDDIEESGKLQQQEGYKQLCRDRRDWSKTPVSVSETEKKTVATPVTKLQSQESNGSNGSNRSSTSSWSDEPANNSMDISTGHMVLAYMEDHLKNKQRLEQEWVALCGYEAEPSSTTVAFKAENKKKNRYPDKLPYDHNRVILNALVNATNSDYINASTVTDHDPRNPSFIVTQGPLGQTVADFWQMVWEQGCVVIVMLTRLQDNGYQLCTRYWPEEGSEQYHIFEVHLVSEHVWCEDYLVRSVYLKNTRTGETRTVTQFHFRSWPAHGVPSSTKALLEFRRKVNKSYRGRSCPIVVHCSDGVGRSGTYVLIDMVLNRLSKGCKEIDIAATLEHIRDQRGGMVQNRQQFEFCLMAVAEEVHAILKALPQQQPQQQ